MSQPAPTELDSHPATAPPERVGAGRRGSLLPRQTLLRHLLYALALAVVIFLLTAALQAKADFRNFQVMQTGYLICAVAGLTLLTGTNGQISLGHGALMLVGAYTAALLQIHQPHLPLIIVLVAAVLVTAAFGVVLGAGAARLRGPYLAGATLALAVGLPSIPIHYTKVLGGSSGLITPANITPPSWLGSSFTQYHWFAWIGSLAALATLVLIANLKRSAVGRNLAAVRDDEVAARLSGLSVSKIQVLAFVVSAASAGLAGGLLVLATSSASPGGFDLTLSIQLLVAAILGGLGSLPGAVVGSIAVVALPSLSSTIVNSAGLSAARGASVQVLLYGLLLILVMLVFPGGLAGLIRRLRAVVSRS